MCNSNLKIKLRWIAVLFVALVGAFIGFLLSFSYKSASAYYANDDDIHTVFYYAETAHTAGYVYNTDFSTDINNSSAVLSKTYYIEIAERTYNQLNNNTNHLVVCWGRKTEMDILANNCKSDSEVGDPSFLIDVSSLEESGICSSLSSAYAYVWFNYNLYGSSFKDAVKFPYVGYRASQSDVIDERANGGSLWLPITVFWSEGNLFDIGIMLTYQYSAGLSSRDTRVNAYYHSF